MSEGLSAESLLCTSCGLCCTGALHDQAALENDELAPAASLGLPVRATQPAPCFALPCPKLDGAGTGTSKTRLLAFVLEAYFDRQFRNRSEGLILKTESCS